MAETVSTNQFKNGMHVEVDGTIYRIVEFQHVKPGKGGAFVRTKLKALGSGAVVDKTFRAGEKMPRIRTEVINVNYLYNDGSDVHLMDSETFDQIALPSDSLSDELQFMRENDTVQLLTVDGKPSSLETGAVVQVPLFVNVGDMIRVDTREARYISRA
jgi:elongation factor P